MSLADHTFLLLPLTPSTFPDPAPLLPLIRETLLSHALKSLTVLVLKVQPHAIYPHLGKNPREAFPALQAWLGEVYGVLGAACWECGRVEMEVEVRFQGEEGTWEPKLQKREGSSQTIALDGFTPDMIPADLLPLLPQPVQYIPSSLRTTASLPLVHPQPKSGPPVIALGGTFDHLHSAHKLLLHLALFLATRKIIVGVMADRLLSSKVHSELVEPLTTRVQRVEDFLLRCGAVRQGQAEEGKVEMDVVEIEDPSGPTAWDEDIQALLVSAETKSGGEMVNNKRKEKGLGELETFVVDVISGKSVGDTGELENLRGVSDEAELKRRKLGSTGIREWLAARDVSQ